MKIASELLGFDLAAWSNGRHATWRGALAALLIERGYSIADTHAVVADVGAAVRVAELVHEALDDLEARGEIEVCS